MKTKEDYKSGENYTAEEIAKEAFHHENKGKTAQEFVDEA